MNLPQVIKKSKSYALIRSVHHGIARKRRIHREYLDNRERWGETYAVLEKAFAESAGKGEAGNAAWKAKEQYLLDWFRQELDVVIQSYRTELPEAKNGPIPPIVWIYWWDGFDNAPPLVKACVRSTIRNRGPLEVRLIDKNNLCRYISMPEHLLKKQEEGKLGKAHFSDVARMKLLAQYGGYWMDATLFCSRPIPAAELSAYPFYTCKKLWNGSTPSHGMWSGWMFGGVPGYRFFRFMADALTAYWSAHEKAIDYLMMDYLFQIACSEFQELKDAIDSLPPQNLARDELMARINEAYTASFFENDSFVYKLSYRYGRPVERTADGKPTFYSYILYGNESRP